MLWSFVLHFLLVCCQFQKAFFDFVTVRSGRWRCMLACSGRKFVGQSVFTYVWVGCLEFTLFRRTRSPRGDTTLLRAKILFCFLLWKKVHFSLQNTTHFQLHINLTKHHNHKKNKKHLTSFQGALSVSQTHSVTGNTTWWPWAERKNIFKKEHFNGIAMLPSVAYLCGEIREGGLLWQWRHSIGFFFFFT